MGSFGGARVSPGVDANGDGRRRRAGSPRRRRSASSAEREAVADEASLQRDLQDAMRARDRLRIDVLRGVIAAVKNVKVEKQVRRAARGRHRRASCARS